MSVAIGEHIGKHGLPYSSRVIGRHHDAIHDRSRSIDAHPEVFKMTPEIVGVRPMTAQEIYLLLFRDEAQWQRVDEIISQNVFLNLRVA